MKTFVRLSQFLAVAGLATVLSLSATAQQAPPAAAGRGAGPQSITVPAGTKIDSNVIYGMYSGLAMLMDVYHPASPNGYGVIFVHGGHWRMSGAIGAAAPKTNGNIAQ